MSSPCYTSTSAVGIAISAIGIAATIGATRAARTSRETRGIISQVAIGVVTSANRRAICVRCRTVGVAAARVAGVLGSVWHYGVDVFVSLPFCFKLCSMSPRELYEEERKRAFALLYPRLGHRY